MQLLPSQLIRVFIHFSSSYKHADATAFTNAHFGQGTTPILVDDVACTVYESRLIDCPYDSNVADCTHSEDAGVQCVPRELHQHKHLEYTNQITASCLFCRVYTWQHQTEKWFYWYGG